MARTLAVGSEKLSEELSELKWLKQADEKPQAPANRGRRCRRHRAICFGLTVTGVLGCTYSSWPVSRLQRHWRSPPQQRQQQQQQQEEGRSQLAGWDTIQEFVLMGQEPAYISWAKHPEKCWALPKEKIENGVKVQIRDCGKTPEKFLIPAGGPGKIRPARYPDYCLDAPKGSTVMQLYQCAHAPHSNLGWEVPKDRSGHIRPTNLDDKCVDVPGGRTDNGTPLQQWNCSKIAHDNEGFIIHWPADCRWGQWSQWAPCSKTCSGHTSRERKSAKDGGSECAGHETERRECNAEACSSHTASAAKRGGGEDRSGAARGSLDKVSCIILITIFAALRERFEL